MQTTLEPKRLCAADDALWHTYRNGGIGASEAAAACHISEWQTALELYYRKRGEIPPIEENRAMRLGRMLEPIIADEFERETGLRIAERSPGLFCHPDFAFILATPDNIIDPETLVETKTMNDRRAMDALGEPFTDEVPLEWNVQCQQQMLVMGAKLVYIPVLVGGSDLRVYEIHRNEKMIGGIIQKVEDLWTRIQTGNPPELMDHRTGLQLVKELFGEVKTGSIIDLSDESAECWSRYEARTRVIRDLEAERDNLKARVLYELGENEAGRLPDGRCVRRKECHRAGYEVEPTSYIDVRAVSAKTYA